MTTRAVAYFAVAAHFWYHFWYASYYDWNYVNIPPTVHPMGITYGRTNKLKFLTYWDALLQSLFFTISFLNEIWGNTEVSPSPRNNSIIRKLKDLILPSLAFPISMFVGLTFWGLYLVDRELVFPKAIDPYFPPWLNHVMHTNIMVFVLLEMYMSFRRYPSRPLGLGILAIFMLCYLVWLHVIYIKTGIWVYPILEKLNLAARVVFFVSLLSLSVVLYIVGEKINQRIWLNRVKFEKTR
ncbi:FAR-17a/AIG1-like protein [Popillia japonica]|uniref:FAR-17a/AIG1-like protein n=1 Tax=Popillia japonica TaxID=7064 RepID=A0AAW1J0K0_POPJA